MIFFLISILAFECFLIFLWAIKKSDRLVQFPFLSVAVFLGFVLPQLVGLSNNPYLPENGLERTIFISILCLAGCFFGYVNNKKRFSFYNSKLSDLRLLICSILMSLIGSFFYYKTSQLALDANDEFGGQWSGIITVYVFFSRFLAIGFAISILLFLKKSDKFSLAVIVFDLLFYLDRIIVHGRRADMVELVLFVLLAIWYQRRFVPSRLFFIAIVFMGTLIINSIGDYRNTMLNEENNAWSGAGISNVSKIDFIGNMKKIIDGEVDNNEMLNATVTISSISESSNFDFGVSFWNDFIKFFVPAQFLGNSIKEALIFEQPDIAYGVYGYEKNIGSTVTGMTDVFQSFWYFGWIVFYWIGSLMSKLNLAADEGLFSAKLIIMLTCTTSLQAITHFSHLFFLEFFRICLFVFPVIYFSRIQKNS